MGELQVTPRFKVLPIRAPKHLERVRGLGYCCLCGRRDAPIEAHHDRRDGWGGIGRKPCDSRVANVCFFCHLEIHANGPAKLERKYGRDLRVIVAWLAFHSRCLGLLRGGAP